MRIPINVTYYLHLVFRAWVTLILACVILSVIVIYNHWRYSREEKSSISQPNILIKEWIKVERKSRRLRAAQTRENRHKECEEKVNKLLHNFIKDLIFNPIYQDLYTAVHQLKCVFVSTFFSLLIKPDLLLLLKSDQILLSSLAKIRENISPS